MRRVVGAVVVVVLPLSGCAEPDEAPPLEPEQDEEAVDLDALHDELLSEIMDDESPVAAFLDGLYAEAGFDLPAGVTDSNVIRYGLATCVGSPSPPSEWEVGPEVLGNPPDVVETFARTVERHAAGTICGRVP